jgi:hypothetical protein
VETISFGDYRMKYALTIGILLIPVALSAQEDVAYDKRLKRIEIFEGVYITVPHERQVTSPAYRYASRGFFTVQVNVSDSGQNILGDAANEPSIAVDPNNTSRIAIGWRQFNTVSSNFRQAGYAYTLNGGQTWTFPGVIQPGIFRSDPVLDSDAEGNFYYNSLTSDGFDYWCNVFKSTNAGASWDTGTYAMGGDKQWMVVDKSGGMGNGHIYAYWTSYFSICSPGFFTRSANRGASYENCVAIPGNPHWGTLAVGAYGELYVCGWGDTSFVIARSTSARDSSLAVTWDMMRPVSLGGEIRAFAGYSSPNPVGLLGQAWVSVDRSNGPTRGNVYVLCSVQRYSNSDPLDVMFTRSTDAGLTWSVPVRVNDDPTTTAWQWFGTMSVAPNGRIDVVWLDTRDNPGSVNSSLYYAYSMDAGVTWSTNERLSPAFNPHVGWPQQDKMGDYFDMVSDDEGVHLAWAATFNNEQDVYYGRISTITDVSEEQISIPENFILSQNYPNPFNPSTVIRYSLPVNSLVSLKVYTMLGQEAATLVNEVKQAGMYETTFDGTRLPSGIYSYRIQATGFTQTKKLILLR